MKYIASFLFSLLLSNFSQAALLCNASCTLDISFPDGGSIQAIEALSFEFGTGGLINTGGSTTAYPAGDSLIINQGESLNFASGGHFNLGESGNVDFQKLKIITSGVVELAADSGTNTLNIHSQSVFETSGGGRLILRSPLWLAGSLVSDGSIEILNGIHCQSGCTHDNASGVSLNFGSINIGNPPVLIENLDQLMAEVSHGGGPWLPPHGPIDPDLVIGSAAPTVPPAKSGGSGSFDLVFLLLLMSIGLCRRFRA